MQRGPSFSGQGLAERARPLFKFAAASLAFWCACIASLANAQSITDPTRPPPSTPPTPSSASQPAPPAVAPLTLTAAYTADFLDDVSGGAATGSGYVHLIKLSAAYDGSISGQDGLSGLFSAVDLSGSHFTSRRVGGIQSISASETDFAALKPYEVWIQQEFSAGRGAVKGGLIDINTTFDVQETAALFLNASHGIGPDLGDTGLNGPSDFPTPTLGVTSYYRPADGWTAQLGVFNGAAGDPAHKSDFVALDVDGALLIGQVEKRFGDAARMELGAWRYSARFSSLSQFTPAGTARKIGGDGGVYGLAEGRLLAKVDQSGGLNGWVRIGFANGEINEVSDYFGAGLVYTGPLEGRAKDEAGVAIARAGIGAGGRYLAAQLGHGAGRSETDLEATYRYAARDWLNLQPDVQYVIDPHGYRKVANAVVVGLRVAFTYTRQ